MAVRYVQYPRRDAVVVDVSRGELPRPPARVWEAPWVRLADALLDAIDPSVPAERRAGALRQAVELDAPEAARWLVELLGGAHRDLARASGVELDELMLKVRRHVLAHPPGAAN